MTARKTGGAEGTPAAKASRPLIQSKLESLGPEPNKNISKPPKTAPTAIMESVSMKTAVMADPRVIRFDFTLSLRMTTTRALPGTYLPSWLKK